MKDQYYIIQEGEYTPKTSDNSSSENKARDCIDDKQILRNFLDRFKTWEQLQRPWSGKL